MFIDCVLTHMMTLHHTDVFLQPTLEITLAHYRFCIEDQIDLNLFIRPMNLEMFSSFVLQTWHLLSSPPAWIDFAVWEKQRGKQQYPLLRPSNGSFLLLFFSFALCYRIKSLIPEITKTSSFDWTDYARIISLLK